jgi:hypothetical protein
MLYSFGWYLNDDKLKKILKELIEVLTWHLLGGSDENKWKTSVRIAGVSAEIRTENL